MPQKPLFGFAWVTQGREEHHAMLLEPLVPGLADVLIKWVTLGKKERVPVSSVRVEDGDDDVASSERGGRSRSRRRRTVSPKLSDDSECQKSKKTNKKQSCKAQKKSKKKRSKITVKAEPKTDPAPALVDPLPLLPNDNIFNENYDYEYYPNFESPLPQDDPMTLECPTNDSSSSDLLDDVVIAGEAVEAWSPQCLSPPKQDRSAASPCMLDLDAFSFAAEKVPSPPPPKLHDRPQTSTTSNSTNVDTCAVVLASANEQETTQEKMALPAPTTFQTQVLQPIADATKKTATMQMIAVSSSSLAKMLKPQAKDMAVPIVLGDVSNANRGAATMKDHAAERQPNGQTTSQESEVIVVAPTSPKKERKQSNLVVKKPPPPPYAPPTTAERSTGNKITRKKPLPPPGNPTASKKDCRQPSKKTATPSLLMPSSPKSLKRKEMQMYETNADSPAKKSKLSEHISKNEAHERSGDSQEKPREDRKSSGKVVQATSLKDKVASLSPWHEKSSNDVSCSSKKVIDSTHGPLLYDRCGDMGKIGPLPILGSKASKHVTIFKTVVEPSTVKTIQMSNTETESFSGSLRDKTSESTVQEKCSVQVVVKKPKAAVKASTLENTNNGNIRRSLKFPGLIMGEESKGKKPLGTTMNQMASTTSIRKPVQKSVSAPNGKSKRHRIFAGARRTKLPQIRIAPLQIPPGPDESSKDVSGQHIRSVTPTEATKQEHGNATESPNSIPSPVAIKAGTNALFPKSIDESPTHSMTPEARGNEDSIGSGGAKAIPEVKGGKVVSQKRKRKALAIDQSIPKKRRNETIATRPSISKKPGYLGNFVNLISNKVSTKTLVHHRPKPAKVEMGVERHPVCSQPAKCSDKEPIIDLPILTTSKLGMKPDNGGGESVNSNSGGATETVREKTVVPVTVKEDAPGLEGTLNNIDFFKKSAESVKKESATNSVVEIHRKEQKDIRIPKKRFLARMKENYVSPRKQILEAARAAAALQTTRGALAVAKASPSNSNDIFQKIKTGTSRGKKTTCLSSEPIFGAENCLENKINCQNRNKFLLLKGVK